jgi:hypothetical protein
VPSPKTIARISFEANAKPCRVCGGRARIEEDRRCRFVPDDPDDPQGPTHSVQFLAYSIGCEKGCLRKPIECLDPAPGVDDDMTKRYHTMKAACELLLEWWNDEPAPGGSPAEKE